MRRPRVPPVLLLALRDVARRPGEHAVLGAALAAVVVVAAVPMLFSEALATTTERVLADAPSLVVRRVDGGGFAPVEVFEGLAALRSVRGVARAEARRWGVATSPLGPVTVVGVDETSRARLAALDVAAPGSGEAVVGRSLAGASLALRGPGAPGPQQFVVRAVLPPGSDAVAHDVVLLEWGDAAALLGLPPGTASDLAVWVAQEPEEEAIRGDLERALPWPVRITGRAESRRALAAALGRRAGLSAVAAVPAALALALLVVATARQGRAGRREVAILKVLGWTSTDVAWMRLIEALAVGAPAVVIGLALAYGVVVWPGAPSLVGAALGWSGPPPDLALDGEGALVVMAGVAGVVLAPFAAAALWPALRSATADPGELLDGASAE